MNREEIEKKIVDLARETTGAQLTETVTLKDLTLLTEKYL